MFWLSFDPLPMEALLILEAAATFPWDFAAAEALTPLSGSRGIAVDVIFCQVGAPSQN